MVQKLRLRKMWVTDNFRKLLYEEKAKKPDKNLTEIMDDMSEEYQKQKRRSNGFIPRF